MLRYSGMDSGSSKFECSQNKCGKKTEGGSWLLARMFLKWWIMRPKVDKKKGGLMDLDKVKG